MASRARKNVAYADEVSGIRGLTFTIFLAVAICKAAGSTRLAQFRETLRLDRIMSRRTTTWDRPCRNRASLRGTGAVPCRRPPGATAIRLLSLGDALQDGGDLQEAIGCTSAGSQPRRRRGAQQPGNGTGSQGDWKAIAEFRRALGIDRQRGRAPEPRPRESLPERGR